jgi:hypothetical protein
VRKVGKCFVSLAALALGLALSGTAHAQTWGWIWSGVPTGDSSYSYNSRGGANTVARTGTGTYTVNFPGLGQMGGGNLQVTAYGGDGTYCKIVSWGGNDVSAAVACYGPTGAKHDADFVVHYTSYAGNLKKSWGGYMWNQEAAHTLNSSYSANSTYAWNSAGKSVKITRTGTGVYKVTFDGQTAQYKAQATINAGKTSLGPVALVSGYGTDGNFCQAGDITGTSTSTTIKVMCFKNLASPAAANAQFTLSFGSVRTLFSSSQGYMYSACGSSAVAPKSANLFISNLPGAESMQTHRLTAGVYALYFPGLVAYNSSFAMVTALSNSSPRRCEVTSWGDAPMGGTQVNVACFDKGGHLADARCNIVYGTSQRTPSIGMRM